MVQDQGVYKNCSLTVLGDPIEEESETDSGVGNVLGMTNFSDQVMDIEHLSQTAPPLEGLIVFNNGPNPDGIADIDLNRWQLVRVFARRGSEFPGARLPLKLDKPSPWLQSVHIQGYEITQQFMNTLAACPNLQRMFIIQSSPQRSPLRVPAPANAANMVSFVFEGSGDDTVTDWRVPSCQLVCVVVRNTSISEIPPRMVEGMADSVILQADFSNNRITAEGAQPLRMFTAASGGLLPYPRRGVSETMRLLARRLQKTPERNAGLRSWLGLRRPGSVVHRMGGNLAGVCAI